MAARGGAESRGRRGTRGWGEGTARGGRPKKKKTVKNRKGWWSAHVRSPELWRTGVCAAGGRGSGAGRAEGLQLRRQQPILMAGGWGGQRAASRRREQARVGTHHVHRWLRSGGKAAPTESWLGEQREKGTRLFRFLCLRLVFTLLFFSRRRRVCASPVARTHQHSDSPSFRLGGVAPEGLPNGHPLVDRGGRRMRAAAAPHARPADRGARLCAFRTAR